MSQKSQDDLNLSGTQAYKQKYEIQFQGDIALARKFMPKVKEIVNGLDFDKQIKDNEGTSEDLKGHDLTILATQVGVRIRRSKYRGHNQFTQDDKERETMSCDVYFFGYANREETDLDYWVVFDYKDYESQRDGENIPCVDRRQNVKHGSVSFNCYRVDDIKVHCAVYGEWEHPKFQPVPPPPEVAENWDQLTHQTT